MKFIVNERWRCSALHPRKVMFELFFFSEEIIFRIFFCSSSSIFGFN